ncbi:hypothetical protein FOA52_012903 [Chlamydomonas sp. UWO 241]|nr:hypothetical protein FOA52_012903 [Chlamydomonas sp. UWO 241]
MARATKQPASEPRHPVLSAINEATKWVVSAAAGLFLLLHHDAPVMWCLLGSIFASFVNKGLKYAINEQRPASARKADPGMPSSHANSLAFLATYSAAALLLAAPQQAAQARAGGAASIVGLSLFLTWLRVVLGYHTVLQVVVGYSVGAASALGWLALGTQHVLPSLPDHPAAACALVWATYAAAAVFAGKNVGAWVKQVVLARGDQPPAARPGLAPS